jgi:hypothetical protein
MAEYTLDNSWDSARRRLSLLEQHLDPMTKRRMNSLGLQPDRRARCRDDPPPGETRELTSRGRFQSSDLPCQFASCIEVALLYRPVEIAAVRFGEATSSYPVSRAGAKPLPTMPCFLFINYRP